VPSGAAVGFAGVTVDARKLLAPRSFAHSSPPNPSPSEHMMESYKQLDLGAQPSEAGFDYCSAAARKWFAKGQVTY
jgi:hypothetical protein